MWQMCSYVPQSLLSGALSEDKLAELTASFFLETFVHAKEKVTTQIGFLNVFLTHQFNF